MTPDDELFLKLGKELARMINDMEKAAKDNPRGMAYTRRALSYPGRRIHMLLTTESEIMDAFENAIKETCDVRPTTPHSERN